MIESFLRRSTDKDPAIVVEMRYEEHNPKGELIKKVDGIFFGLGCYDRGSRPSDSFYDFKGMRISIMPTTLEHLQGRRLILTKPTWSKRAWFARRTVIRAEPSDEPNGASPRRLS
ncbi:MAG TPA: hypothetical protein VL486_02875 [Verrucomicrobiae bacterium]|nr:hypothetical protein [Verrucomicrobiae bacterium]